MEEEQAKEVATREMVDFIRGQYPHLHSTCHFVPDELFLRTKYTALRELSSPFDGVVWRQDETELSSVCCDRTEAAVRKVLRHVIQREPLFVLSNFSFDNYLTKTLSSTEMSRMKMTSSKVKDMFPNLGQLEPTQRRGDFDNLIISRKMGLLVIEAKTIGNQINANVPELPREGVDISDKSYEEKVTQGISQLDKADVVLNHLFHDIRKSLPVTKCLALPNLPRRLLECIVSRNPDLQYAFCRCLDASSVGEAAAKCLCADDMTTWEGTAPDPLMTWWYHVTTDSTAVEDKTKRELSEKEYEVIISRLCGPYSKNTVECRKNAREEVRTVDDVVYLTGVRFGAAVLGEDQLEVFKSDERFVYLAGPPGSGKTLILGLKAVHWAEEGYHVIFLGVEGIAWGSLVSRTLFQRVTEFMRSKVERANKRDRCERGISTGDQTTSAPQGKKKRKRKKRTGNEDLVASVDHYNSQSNHVNGATGCNRALVDVSGERSDDDTSMQTEGTTPTAHGPPLATDPSTQTSHLHYQEVAMDTHAETFLEELVNNYQASGKGLRFVLDEIPEKMTLARLSNNLSGVIRRLAGCVDHYEQLLREADRSEVGGQRETSATPAIEDAALVREDIVKINQHLGIVAKVMEKMVTAKEKHSVLRSDKWPTALVEVDRLYWTLCEYSQRARDCGTHNHHHLEKVQALLQEASGLFFNLQTWLTSFTLHDICSAIVGRGDTVDVGLWGSGVYVTYQPQSLQLKQLTRCLRCPPNVQVILEETNKDMGHPTDFAYTKSAAVVNPNLPLPTQGPPIKLLDHKDHMTEAKEVIDCRKCGETLAEYILDKIGNPFSPLHPEDIFIVGPFDVGEKNPPLIQTLVERGIGVQTEQQTISKPPPYPGCVFAVGGAAVQGLEAKLVVFIPEVSRIPVDKDDLKQFRPDLPDWLRSMDMAGAGGVVMSAHIMPAKTVLLSRNGAYYNDLRLMEYLTRFLGYALVLTMSGLELPHIFKLLKSRCSQGVNIVRVALELQTVSSNVAYCIYHNFPLSTWGENMPLMAQYVTVTCLLLLYSGRERHMLVFVVTYVTCMLLLLLGVVPSHVVDLLQAISIPLTAVSKMQQMYSNSRLGGHEQLTFASLLLLNARSLGRVMTSAVDTRDGLMVLCHAHSCLWEATLTFQALLYVRRQRRLQLQALREKTTVADCAAEDGEEPYRPRRRRCSSVTSRCG